MVPNICATIPLVAGTVDSHKKPKLAPKIKALILLGGKKIKKGNKQKGGFIQEIINVVRGGENAVNGGYYNLTGKVQPISQNPYPTQEQPIDNNYKFIGQSPSNIKQIYIDANNSVAKI